MKKRSCRRTGFEQEQHDRAIRVRKMTDAQLCAYLDELEGRNRSIVISQDELEKVINGFIDSLATRSDTGLRVSDATIRKIRAMAVENGYLIRVSSQTAYHLEAEAERLGISPGRVVDELMRAAKSCGEVCGICGKHHKKRTNKP